MSWLQISGKIDFSFRILLVETSEDSRTCLKMEMHRSKFKENNYMFSISHELFWPDFHKFLTKISQRPENQKDWSRHIQHYCIVLGKSSLRAPEGPKLRYKMIKKAHYIIGLLIHYLVLNSHGFAIKIIHYTDKW